MSKIFKDVQTVVLAKIIGITLGFFNSIFLVRLLGAEGNGIYAKIMATSELLILLTTINFSLATLYFSSKEGADHGKIITISYTLIMTSLIIGGITIFFLPMMSVSSAFVPEKNIAFYSIIVIAIMFFIELRQTYSSILKGRKNFQDLFYSNTFYSGFRFCLFGSLVVLQGKFFSFSIEQIILLHVVTLFLHALCNYFFYKREFKISIAKKLSFREDYAPFLKYSGSSFVAILGGFLSSKANIWLIAFFLNSKELGYFALAVYFFSLVMQFPIVLRNVLMPYLVSGTDEEKEEYLILFSRINATATTIIFIAVMCFADWLVPIFYGAEFSNAVIVIKIMMIAAYLHSTRSIFAVYFYSRNKIKYNIWANYCALGIILIGGVIFIPKYGTVGAAMVSVCAYAFSMIFITSVILFVEKLPLTNYLFLTPGDIKKIRFGLLANRK